MRYLSRLRGQGVEHEETKSVSEEAEDCLMCDCVLVIATATLPQLRITYG